MKNKKMKGVLKKFQVRQIFSKTEDASVHKPTFENFSGYKRFVYESEREPFRLYYGGSLPHFQLAYETWGELNSDNSNAILLHTGLSASSHAKSQQKNMTKGWWEDFIGERLPVDTSKYFV